MATDENVCGNCGGQGVLVYAETLEDEPIEHPCTRCDGTGLADPTQR